MSYTPLTFILMEKVNWYFWTWKYFFPSRKDEKYFHFPPRLTRQARLRVPDREGKTNNEDLSFIQIYSLPAGWTALLTRSDSQFPLRDNCFTCSPTFLFVYCLIPHAWISYPPYFRIFLEELTEDLYLLNYTIGLPGSMFFFWTWT